MPCKQSQTNSSDFTCRAVPYGLQVLALNTKYSLNALLLLLVVWIIWLISINKHLSHTFLFLLQTIWTIHRTIQLVKSLLYQITRSLLTMSRNKKSTQAATEIVEFQSTQSRVKWQSKIVISIVEWFSRRNSKIDRCDNVNYYLKKVKIESAKRCFDELNLRIILSVRGMAPEMYSRNNSMTRLITAELIVLQISQYILDLFVELYEFLSFCAWVSSRYAICVLSD